MADLSDETREQFARAVNAASDVAANLVYEYAGQFERREQYLPLEDLARRVQRAVVETAVRVEGLRPDLRPEPGADDTATHSAERVPADDAEDAQRTLDDALYDPGWITAMIDNGLIANVSSRVRFESDVAAGQVAGENRPDEPPQYGDEDVPS
jgi:hypothetical protein